jgi:sec-independent protein translocase protein TatA
MSVGFQEIVLIGLLFLFLFGAGRLSSIGKGLGEGIKNFKDALEGDPEKKEPEAPKEPKLLGAGDPKPEAPAAKDAVESEKKPAG